MCVSDRFDNSCVEITVAFFVGLLEEWQSFPRVGNCLPDQPRNDKIISCIVIIASLPWYHGKAVPHKKYVLKICNVM